MAWYTSDSLDKLSKQDVIPIALSLQSKLEDKKNIVLQEVRKLNETVSKLYVLLPVTKYANDLLLTRLTILERQCWANDQYSRREYLDIMNIPREVSGEALEETVLKIFRKLGCNISSDSTEACVSRVGRTADTVIVKFSKWMYCQHVLSIKKDLKKHIMEDLELPGNKKLFKDKA